MKYQCDALLPIEARYTSWKFRRLSRWFDPYRQEKALLLELTIMALTPGFRVQHLYPMFHWEGNAQHLVNHLIIPEYRDEAMQYTAENARSITEQDGHDMLVAALDSHPEKMGSVPLYVTRYLQSRRKNGATAAGLAREFNVSASRITRWWLADEFNPLTGQRHDEAVLHRNRFNKPRLGVIV